MRNRPERKRLILVGIMALVVLTAMIGLWLQGGFEDLRGLPVLFVALWILTVAVIALRNR